MTSYIQKEQVSCDIGESSTRWMYKTFMTTKNNVSPSGYFTLRYSLARLEEYEQDYSAFSLLPETL
jgi:hypothetical protein